MEDKEKINFLMSQINKDVDSYKKINEGRTNKTYLVVSQGKKYIARLAGKGTANYINRSDEEFNMKIAEKFGISPHLYTTCDGNLLMEYVDFPTLSNENELLIPETLEKIIKVFISLHKSKIKLHNDFNILENIYVYKNQLENMKVIYPKEFIESEEKLFNAVKYIQSKYNKNKVACHVDNYFGNIIISDNKAILIDWEYAGMCDKYCELANFALINDLSENVENLFLQKYFTSSSENFNIKKYYLFKMASSFMWSYWHLIKLNQGCDVEYNQKRWKERLLIANNILKKLGDDIK